MDTSKFVSGGDWNKAGRPEIDPKRVSEGADIEMEHTGDRATAERIAKDHMAKGYIKGPKAEPDKKDYYRKPKVVAGGDIAKEMKMNKKAEAAFIDELQKIAAINTKQAAESIMKKYDPELYKILKGSYAARFAKDPKQVMSEIQYSHPNLSRHDPKTQKMLSRAYDKLNK